MQPSGGDNLEFNLATSEISTPVLKAVLTQLTYLYLWSLFAEEKKQEMVTGTGP